MRLIATCWLVFFGFLQIASAERPNIVFAFADDWGFHASAYGTLFPGGVNDVVSTPNFDAIAEQGVLFSRAFVSAPSCTPCRSSLMSGQHFWRCGRGAILQGAIWDFSNPAYPLLLESSGYRIGHTYKVWSPGKPGDAPHGGAARAFNKAGRRFNGFSQAAMKANDHEKAKADLLHEVRQNLLSFLDSDNDDQVDGDQPFCYFFGPTNCHRKWIAGSGKTLWDIEPDTLKGKIPPYLPDVQIVREDFSDYFGEIKAFDTSLEVISSELKRLGVNDNTILVVSGDHGFPGVTRGKCNLYDFGTQVPLAIRWPAGIPTTGRVVDDFVTLPDLAPTFLEAANVEIPDSMTARSLIPILKSDLSGQVDSTRDAVFTGRERHVAAARTDFKPYPQRAIRTDQFLFIVNFAPDRWPMGTAIGYGKSGDAFPKFDALRENTFAAFADLDASPTKAWIVTNRHEDPKRFDFAFGRRDKFELYDVIADPHCMTNLANHPSHRKTRDQLHDRLMSELRRTDDPRVSEHVIFESSPFTDPTSKK
ncbi:Choline-sulfatase [Planctomycetes bacterium CA13]|uniref:Choline-sulfatase n=1 Tax=Novipirellula herctigrandis TaxID=2527986 RepID=A0A5C5Z5D4_9BACT|nr:Choline-sulfatase [Planctomycetes bacterium CA13]